MASNGKIKLNTVRFDKNASGDSQFKIGDNLANALEVLEGSTSYLKFVTTNSSEKVVVGKPLGVDTITEATSDTGVTIDGLLIKDDSIRPDAITDPGNAGAIPVTKSGYCPLVTAGAETRTLGAPTFIGQRLQLHLKTDGGDCVVTCSTTINQTGNNTITFNDAGDCIELVAKENGSNLRWSLVFNDGTSLSTV